MSLDNIVHESPDTELCYIRNIHECRKRFLLVRPYLSIFRVQQFEQCLRAIFFYFSLNYKELWANRIHLGSESVFLSGSSILFLINGNIHLIKLNIFHSIITNDLNAFSSTSKDKTTGKECAGEFKGIGDIAQFPTNSQTLFTGLLIDRLFIGSWSKIICNIHWPSCFGMQYHVMVGAVQI